MTYWTENIIQETLYKRLIQENFAKDNVQEPYKGDVIKTYDMII